MPAKAKVLLPPPPRMARKPYDLLREDLRRVNIHLTILGLTPEGRVSVKLVGTKPALRSWLDGCRYQCIPVDEEKGAA